MSELEQWLRGPAGRDVFALLMRGLTEHMRRNGGAQPSWAQPVLQAIADLAYVDEPAAGSVIGTAFGSVVPVDPDMVELSTADLAGKSPEYVRRLCREGRVRCRRVGRTWLVDQESLIRVLGRSAA
jgi:hypothetical protein